jgi:hypothetical protein
MPRIVNGKVVQDDEYEGRTFGESGPVARVLGAPHSSLASYAPRMPNRRIPRFFVTAASLSISVRSWEPYSTNLFGFNVHPVAPVARAELSQLQPCASF